MKMKWGFFTPTHIVTLILALVMNMGLYLLLKGRSKKVQTMALLPFSLLGVAAIVFNLVKWGSPLEYLPLHLCSINAVLLPIVVVTRNKTLGNLLLVWCLGALAALVMNFEMKDVELFSQTFFYYYFPHVFEFGVPLLLIKLGLIRKDPRCIGSTLLLTMLIYTGVHVCNKLINGYCFANDVVNSSGVLIQVNYMFSVVPSNPLVALFHKLVPYEYWYMYMVVPIVAGYLVVIYAPQLYALYQAKRNVRAVSRKTANN